MANTLIFRHQRLGDALITLPIIYALAEKYKEDTFTVISNGRFKLFFDLMPDNVIYISTPYKRPLGLLRSLIYIVRREIFYLKLKKISKKTDKIAFLQWESFERKVYSKFLPSKEIPIEITDEKVLSTEERLVGKCSDGLRITDLHLVTLAKLGYDNIEPKFDPSALKDRDIFNIAERMGIDLDKKIVAIAPFASKKSKMYDLDKMKQVVTYFVQERPDCQVLLAGAGPKEESVVKEWKKEYPTLISLVNKLSFEDEVFILSRANVMLAMDSSNMHLASLLDIPIVSIWGGTTPACGFYPQKESLDNAICSYIDCQPCNLTGLDYCKNTNSYACFDIEHKIIVNKIEGFL